MVDNFLYGILGIFIFSFCVSIVGFDLLLPLISYMLTYEYIYICFKLVGV